MAKLVEAIPNFSEGRDQSVIQALISVANSIPGCTLLDHHTDPSHNRSVLTILGNPQAVEEVAVQLCITASQLIDLTKHQGAHPRMGATDVMPFVPISDMTMEDCVALSRRVAQRVLEEANLPSILYEQSATAPHRANLADVRRGQFEGMKAKLQDPLWTPDYGDPAPHPTAGITAIGARMPLVAFNVNLSTSDLEIANKIAKIVRGSSGGLKYCKAIPILLEDRNIAQVSMNMVNYEGTPLYRAVELIRAEARRWGVSIIGTELVGMCPAKALIDCAEYYLQLEDFSCTQQVLEYHMILE